MTKKRTHGRPKGRKGRAVNLYIPNDILKASGKLAFDRHLSLSQLVSDLLSREAVAARAA